MTSDKNCLQQAPIRNDYRRIARTQSEPGIVWGAEAFCVIYFSRRVTTSASAAALNNRPKLLEFFDGETSVTDDTAHCVFIDRVVARNRENAIPVTHHDVLTLIDDFETGLF